MEKYKDATPGPWEVKPLEPDKGYIRVRGTALGCHYKIANVSFEYMASPKEAHANARLIADAPMLAEQNAKMLELLSYIHQHSGNSAWEITIREKISALISEMEDNNA